jgi:hypothetical protein
LAGTYDKYILTDVVQSRQAPLDGPAFSGVLTYMSTSFTASHPISSRAVSPQILGKSFGELIRNARMQDGRPLEEIAPLAGLTVKEWTTIEAGQVPDTVEHVYLLAAVLYLGRSWRDFLVQLCVGVWEQK